MRAYTFPTAETVIDQAVSEAIGSTASSLTALQTTSLIRKLDQINRTFVNCAHTMHQGGAWSWMQDVTNFQTKAGTTLDGAVTTSDTTIDLVSASDFDSAGRFWVKTSKGAIDFIDYTGKSSNQLTGVTDIDIAHADAEKAQKCYALPSRFAKARRLLINNYEYHYQKQELLPVYGTYYTRGAYIVLPEDVSTQDATFYFEKSPTDISTGDNNTDLATSLDIPEDFMWYAINSLMGYIYRTRRKREDAQVADAMAADELDKALNYDVNQSILNGVTTDY